MYDFASFEWNIDKIATFIADLVKVGFAEEDAIRMVGQFLSRPLTRAKLQPTSPYPPFALGVIRYDPDWLKRLEWWNRQIRRLPHSAILGFAASVDRATMPFHPH